MSEAIRVLYVDDEPRFAETMAARLEGLDDRLTVDTAATASDGRRLVAEAAYDCVVSEYDLPGMDGIEFFEDVREDCPDLPFVLYTASGSEAIAAEAVNAGVAGYLEKGGDADQHERLLTRIEEAVPESTVELSNREIDGEFRGQRSLLTNVIEQIPTHMYVKDREGRHLWVSGHDVNDEDSIPDSDEHVGKTDLELYPEELSRESYEDDIRVIENGEPLIGKVEYEPAADEWIMSNKVPWYDESGEIVGLIGVTRRITERKEHEQRLERQNEQLDEFVSMVSHDLRTPLTVASAYLEQAQEECECPHLEEVAVALDRMDRMIEELLTLAREGKQAVDLGPACLSTLAQGCWESLSTAEATLEIETERVVRADDGRLTQLFENLFRNAVQHGGRDVTVTVGDVEDGFFVEDDGVGIPQDERERVFERGYSTARKGTGFGLSIVETVVETHGWEIDLTDGEDGGVSDERRGSAARGSERSRGARFEITGVEFVE